MAKKKEKGLIGLDPLAWMSDESEKAKNLESQVDIVAETNNVDVDVDVDVVTDHPIEITTEILAVNDEVIQEEIVVESDRSTTVLNATLTIQNVSVLYEQLFKQLERHNKIDIDASAVSSIDTATLQMLIVLKKTAMKEHKEVGIDFPSEKFIEAANLLGLSEMLGVDHVASGLF